MLVSFVLSLFFQLIGTDEVNSQGFEQEKLDPIYLLALLARERLRLCVRSALTRDRKNESFPDLFAFAKTVKRNLQAGITECN